MLMKESYTRNIRQGDFFCLENYTKVEHRLHILMSGRMCVKCDGMFLHNIGPNEFVDSVEWKAKDFENTDVLPEPTFRVIGRLLKNSQKMAFQVRLLKRRSHYIISTAHISVLW